MYMCVCARIVAGGRHRQNFPPAISKYFWKKSLMRWSTCRTLPSRSAWGSKGLMGGMIPLSSSPPSGT